jgi:hypothetical protein
MRRRRPFLLALGLGCWALVLFSATSALAADVPILRLAGPAQTHTLTAAEFAALPRTELRAIETHENKERLYSGVTVRELLTRVGAPLGDKMRGPALALGVLVRTKDDYAVLFYLADFDSAFSTRTLLLADREDGAAPPATAAPFRLVAPGGSRGARWARMVTSIEIISIPVKP